MIDRSVQAESPRWALNERVALVVGLLVLVIAPWWLASVRLPAQVTLSALAGLSLGAALFLPGAPARERLARLKHFPPLWPGLLFLGYVLVQNLNPSYEFRWDHPSILGYRMEALPEGSYIAWLPSGIKGLFWWFDGWRQLMILGGVFALSLSLWLSAHQRKAALLVLWVIALNATLQAGVALAQIITESELILWHFESANRFFVGTFVYRNHGAAFLVLCSGVLLSLGLYFLRRAERKGLKSSPFPLLTLFWLICLLAVIFTGSRGGALLGMMSFLGGGVLMTCQAFHLGGRILIGLLLMFLALGAIGFSQRHMLEKGLQRLMPRLQDTAEEIEGVKEGYLLGQQRTLLTRATWEMSMDRPWYGWGAGSFRYFFPHYQDRYPDLLYLYDLGQEGTRQRLMPEHMQAWRKRFYYAHNDWVHYLAEYGVVGYALLQSCLLSCVAVLVAHWQRWHLYHMAIALTLGLILVHSFLDFILSNLAILYTFSCLTIILVRLVLFRRTPTTSDFAAAHSSPTQPSVT